MASNPWTRGCEFGKTEDRMRTKFFVIGLVVSVLVGGVGGWLWWALGPRAPSASTTLPPVPPLPDTVNLPSTPEPSESSESSVPTDSVPEVAVGVIDSGTLVVEARGRRLGTEDYILERLENGDLSLRSQGTLNFKIAFVNTQATFVQAMAFTAQRRPISYQLALDGPVGIGSRRVSASFGPITGIVADGERQVEIALPEEPFLLLGMFSSYVIMPLWATPTLAQKLKVISLRGDRRDQGSNWVVLEYVGPVTLRSARGDSWEAEEYLVKSERVVLKLYISGERLLALQNDSQKSDESFRLYRSDLFPGDFEVLSGHD